MLKLKNLFLLLKHKYIKGEWTPGKNAGGCRNDFASFAINPQYLLHIIDTGEHG